MIGRADVRFSTSHKIPKFVDLKAPSCIIGASGCGRSHARDAAQSNDDKSSWIKSRVRGMCRQQSGGGGVSGVRQWVGLSTA